MLVYCIEQKQLVAFEEGTGDNLLYEDIEAGYNAYWNYYQYVIDNDAIESMVNGEEISGYAGGMYLFNSEDGKNLEARVNAFLEYVFEKPVRYVKLQ